MPQSRRKCVRISDLLCWVLLCGLGFWTVYRFAEGTTPLLPDNYVWDSALFQVIGKLWADGLTPYVDIFDHKGPLLFLIQKIAYSFSQPRVALYVLESLLVSLSLGFGYQTLRLKMNAALSFAGTVLILVFWLPVMEYGNLCETHSMPWIMLALWLQMRYMAAGSSRHPWGYAFVYGLCFGANVMIRPNNGILIAVITLVITVELALRREWKNILQNALALIAGVLVPIVPFVAYFHAQGALQEFVYATWTFNLLYAKSLEFTLDWQGLRNVMFFITPSALCLFLGALCCLRRRWAEAGVLGLSAVATLMITLSGVGYAHYFMLHVPLVALALYGAAGIGAQGKLWRWLAAAACVGFALLSLRTTLPYAYRNYLQPPAPQEIAAEQAYDEMCAAISEQIPQEEQDRVAVCGLAVTDAELFLKTELQPVGRYCFLVDWHARADQSILSTFDQTLRSGEAQWVVCRVESTPQLLLETLQAHYELHAEYENSGTAYRLYRWK